MADLAIFLVLLVFVLCLTAGLFKGHVNVVDEIIHEMCYCGTLSISLV